MKHCLSVVLASAIALSLFSCGGEKTTKASSTEKKTSTEKKEVITLQVYDQLANYSGEQVGWFGKILLDKFNVKLNIIPETGNTLTTRMESKNLGDIVIWGADSDDYLNAVKSGLLFDWEEEDLVKEYGPDIYANMKNAMYKNRMVSGQNKVYGIANEISPSSKERSSFMYTWDLRFDLYKQLGYPEIKNYDDLFNVLKQMKDICPKDDNGKDTYALSLFPDWDGSMVMFVKSLGTAYRGWDEFGFGYYNPEDGTYHSCLEENGPYLESLKFLNRLYREGLLDPDSQTQHFDSMAEDYKNGTAFFQIFNFMGSTLYNSDEHLAEGKGMFPVCPTNASPIVYGQSVYGANRVWSIGANTEYPELCMEIINWLCTPEGTLTLQYGPKGVTWDYDANGKTYFTDLGKKCQSSKKTQMPAEFGGTFEDGEFKMNNTTWSLDAPNPDSNGEKYNKDSWESNKKAASSTIEQDWRTWAKADSADEYMGKHKYVLAPVSTYSPTEQIDELKAKSNQVATCIKTGTWRAMYAKNDEEFKSLVDAMIKEAKSYGFDECNEYQTVEALNRKNAENLLNF